VAAAPRARPLDLIPSELRPRRLSRAQALTAALACLAVVAGIAAALVPGYRDTRVLATTNAEIARLEPEVRAVERVSRELERRQSMLGMAETLQASSVRPLPVLRELTELIPTDAWVTTLSLDSKGIEITGQAAAASALIPLLENSSRFERVEFASPVTRGRDREQFRIRAAWEAPPGGAAPGGSVTGPPAAGTTSRSPAASDTSGSAGELPAVKGR
jgi:Tfp pilus assembly protein PilN